MVMTAPTLSKLILLLALGVVVLVARAHRGTSLRGGSPTENVDLETSLLDRGLLVGGDVNGTDDPTTLHDSWNYFLSSFDDISSRSYNASELWRIATPWDDDDVVHRRFFNSAVTDVHEPESDQTYEDGDDLSNISHHNGDDVHTPDSDLTFDAVSGARQKITYDGCCTETSWSPTNNKNSTSLFATLVDCPVGCAYANAGVQASNASIHIYLWSGVLKIDALHGSGELNVSGAQFHVPASTPLSVSITPNNKYLQNNRFWMDGSDLFFAGTQFLVLSPTAPFQLVPQANDAADLLLRDYYANENGPREDPAKELVNVTLKDPATRSNMRGSKEDSNLVAETFTIRVTTSFVERQKPANVLFY